MPTQLQEIWQCARFSMQGRQTFLRRVIIHTHPVHSSTKSKHYQTKENSRCGKRPHFFNILVILLMIFTISKLKCMSDVQKKLWMFSHLSKRICAKCLKIEVFFFQTLRVCTMDKNLNIFFQQGLFIKVSILLNYVIFIKIQYGITGNAHHKEKTSKGPTKATPLP